MEIPDHPLEVLWDITYACPLRCTHCYSESGRRPARRLSGADMLRAADAILALGARGVCLAGGEPLLVPELFAVAERFTAAGVSVSLFTSGWTLDRASARAAARAFSTVSVSLDGATAAVHDRIRGRRGSFDRAVAALGLLDGAGNAAIGVDYVVMRSNVHQVEEFLTAVAPRLPGLGQVSFGAVVPEGLASRPGFAEHELLDDARVRLLGSAEYGRRLQELAPPGVRVTSTDNLALRMSPDLVAAGVCLPVLQIEPDGAVRAMAAYEGTVGNVLTDDPAELWRRAVARWHDPFVREALGAVRTMREWAEATRAIDLRFGTEADRRRIARRPEFLPGG
ncbi:MoaA/NifB/PqqE/SkfB family radical SAM enzyme [Streptomyces sp. PanSC19]|uniref:radical SAM protein n=1 Tax=Streptomyces sp. PanSC19 TaxID=1520455 RepID=UPI000F4862CA|nr:radical SAM protein [Streptomyces sp. PanSC19]ROQ36163.1 MoaA/NifB/PqqE/SkfB family radical SAM enzyme [Streptomyces sp. PanSC19]